MTEKAKTKMASLVLDKKALEAAKKNLENGVVTPSLGTNAKEIVEILNGALATELVCVLRYRRHHFTVEGALSAKIKEEFLIHANEELGHADLLAERIVQLGGEPNFNPDALSKASHADYDESKTLKEMVKSNLVAERVAIESYRQMIALVGEKDPTTRQMLEGILAMEEEHADELKDWLQP
ncbi:MAG: ferritin-like domain-containing protein [Firmicutes bacterium]|nr:ferritin-like domain-containing protein [Bacillota bacterium]